MIDFELDLERFRRGDHAYFEGVMRAYKQLVMTVARDFGDDEDEVDDLLQAVWWHVYDVRRSFSARGSFQGWLHKVTINTCRMHSRKKSKWLKLLIKLERDPVPGATPVPPPDPLEAVISDQARSRVEANLERLTEREREAVRLHFLEGRPYGEVGKMMGVEKTTARSLVRYGFNRLRESPGTLEEYADDMP
jgi:RNA polymerase sigma-70 factor (ECF subfamily)